MAKAKYKWSAKEQEGSKMVRRCLSADLPAIYCNKDGTYTVKCCGEKPMTYKEWSDAEKRAAEIGIKKAKEVRKFEKKEKANE